MKFWLSIIYTRFWDQWSQNTRLRNTSARTPGIIARARTRLASPILGRGKLSFLVMLLRDL